MRRKVSRNTGRNPDGYIYQFWAEVVYSFVGQGCWEYSKNQTEGYGRFSVNGKRHVASRYAYESVYGPIPPGLVVCHKCDNPSCVRPDHLFLGTHRDNSDDKIRKNRQARGKKVGGKLDDNLVIQIFTSFESPSVVIRKFGISYSTYTRIKNRKVWAHVTSNRRK